MGQRDVGRLGNIIVNNCTVVEVPALMQMGMVFTFNPGNNGSPSSATLGTAVGLNSPILFSSDRPVLS